MAERPLVLFDVNVILDVLQPRRPFYDDSAASFAAAETGKITGLAAAHTVTTLFYLLVRWGSQDSARAHIVDLLSVLSVAAVDARVIEQALALPYRDLEDAVQMAAAHQARADYLVTRDRAGYGPGLIPAVTPAELHALISVETVQSPGS
jgi:predicted nucleic acid-binding protein